MRKNRDSTSRAKQTPRGGEYILQLLDTGFGVLWHYGVVTANGRIERYRRRHGPSAWLLWWCGCGGGCLRITFDFDFFNFIIRKKNIPNFVNKLKIVNDLMFKATHIDNLLDRNERLNTKSN